MNRLSRIINVLIKKNLDGLLLSLPANISYATGYLSRDSWLLITPKKCIYITDSRYSQEAKKYLSKDFSVAQIQGSFYELLLAQCKKWDIRKLGFEENHLTVSQFQRLKQRLSLLQCIPASGIVENLRLLKLPEEIDKIRKATFITLETLASIEEMITPGKREIEIAGELERFIRYHGGSSSSFDIIVASGPNSSYPHHISSKRKIESNEPVLIDIGVDYEGYKSDLTRVFFSGKITTLAQKIRSLVLKAHDKAIKAIKPGILLSRIDAAGRCLISQAGYGKFFGHAIGHGIGLEVHEAPRISAKEESFAQEGMVFTIEPAVYLPQRFGIRIEDMVRVTKKGAEILSGTLN